MKAKRIFKFYPRHFIVAIGVLFVLTIMKAENESNHISLSDTDDFVLRELNEFTPDKAEITFLFFYHKDSELCRKMRYNIEQLNRENIQGINFYAVDSDQFADYYYKYNVSGIPNIIVLKKEREIKRIMGIVSTDNLKKIIDRHT
ncbi:MAG: thioredoxin family protein [Proteiniphilum sp.]